MLMSPILIYERFNENNSRELNGNDSEGYVCQVNKVKLIKLTPASACSSHKLGRFGIP